MTQSTETLWSLTRRQRLGYAGTMAALGCGSLLMFGPPQLAKLALDAAVSGDLPAAPAWLAALARSGVAETSSLREFLIGVLSVLSATRVVVIEDGQITELGTHAELMAARGHYHELYRHQSLQPSRGSLQHAALLS